MNFTGGNTLASIGKRINWHLATLAGGLGLAVSAGVLVGAFEQEASRGATIKASPSLQISEPVVPVAMDGAPGLVYILVGSEAEALALQATISTDAASMTGDARPVTAGIVEVVVVETAQQEAEFAARWRVAASELLAANTSVRIVDSRD